MTAGEAWTRDVLRELRAKGYGLRAWARFFDSAFERARTVRHERRREHRQALLIGTVGFAAWIAVAPFRPWLALAGALWWLLVTVMLDWHLGMLEDEHGRPRRQVGLPNLLSLARLAVAPALPIVSPAVFAAILIPVGITDGIDGRLARARGETTRLGTWLDGGADGLMLSAAAVGAARDGLLPWWAAALVLGRHACQWLVVAVAYFVCVNLPQPGGGVFSAKAAGFALFTGLAFAALRLPGGLLLVSAGAAGGIATFGLTLVGARRLQPAA